MPIDRIMKWAYGHMNNIQESFYQIQGRMAGSVPTLWTVFSLGPLHLKGTPRDSEGGGLKMFCPPSCFVPLRFFFLNPLNPPYMF